MRPLVTVISEMGEISESVISGDASVFNPTGPRKDIKRDRRGRGGLCLDRRETDGEDEA